MGFRAMADEVGRRKPCRRKQSGKACPRSPSVVQPEPENGGKAQRDKYDDGREKFRSAEAFASWLGLCPDNRISGGRILKAGTRKVTNRIANILRMAANALSREQGRMGEYVRRFKGRLGKAEGIVAGAHT